MPVGRDEAAVGPLARYLRVDRQIREPTIDVDPTGWCDAGPNVRGFGESDDDTLPARPSGASSS